MADHYHVNDPTGRTLEVWCTRAMAEAGLQPGQTVAPCDRQPAYQCTYHVLAERDRQTADPRGASTMARRCAPCLVCSLDHCCPYATGRPTAERCPAICPTHCPRIRAARAAHQEA